MIKCVVWDIDHTLLDGVYLESPDRPPPGDAAVVAALRELAGRGIVHALASKNPAEAASYVRQQAGVEFVAAELGWGSKAAAIRRITAWLDIGADEVAFVDDDMLERAEVAAALPQVLVLTPADAVEAPGWPSFRPPVVTDEARRRAAMYQARRQRQAALAEFGGSRDEFLRRIGTRVTIAWAAEPDVPRLHELSVRTHQLNSSGAPLTEAELAALIAAPGHRVVVVRLADRFGDDGTVGGAIITGGVQGCWRVPAVMMSCRALGRGVLDALLAWMCRAAAAAGAARLEVPCLVTERNVPMRLALARAGLRAGREPAPPGGRTVFARPLDGELPAWPSWVSAPS